MAITKATASSIAPAAKGDLVVGSGTNDAAVLSVASTAGYLLSVDSAEATGLKWAAPAAGGGFTSLASGNLSSVAVSITSISSSYTDLYLVIRNWWHNATGIDQNQDFTIQFNSDDGTVYYNENTNSTRSSITALALQTNANQNNFAAFYIYDYANTSHNKNVLTIANSRNSSNAYDSRTQMAMAKITSAISSIQMIRNSGTFSGGSYVLYGVK
jgi:hypothetical protein